MKKILTLNDRTKRQLHAQVQLSALLGNQGEHANE